MNIRHILWSIEDFLTALMAVILGTLLVGTVICLAIAAFWPPLALLMGLPTGLSH